MKLTNSKKTLPIVSNVEVAKSPWARMKGLLGRTQMPDDFGLWIKPCNNIHTCFMNFPIDVMFLNKNCEVTSTANNVQPWKLLIFDLKAHSVVELPPGTLTKAQIEKGDTIHVLD
jgi:uncharacterized membrane protein (UPF0127 family)